CLRWVSYSIFLFFFSSRRRHTRFSRDWSSDVCSSDLQSSLHFFGTAFNQLCCCFLVLLIGLLLFYKYLSRIERFCFIARTNNFYRFNFITLCNGIHYFLTF